MKAEEVFLKIGNEFFNEILTLEEFSKEPDFNIIPKAMREYARIQIEKDRENSKLLLKQHLQTHVAGYTPCCIEVFKNRPIILD